MKMFVTTLLAALALLAAGCDQLNTSQSAIEELKAGQEELKAAQDELKTGQKEIREELAAIRKLIEPKAPPSPVAEVDLDMDITGDPYAGSADAPLVIVEYTDYQCPFCGRHAKSVLPLIKENYIDTGKVRYVARDFPLPFHQQAPKASEAAHCAADQDKYWAMHDQLFSNQKALGEEQLVTYAGNIGLDMEAFKQCLDSGKYAQKVEQNIAEARKAGINGTPSFVIGFSGKDTGNVAGQRLIRGALGYPNFQQAFDEMLKEKN